MSIIRLNTIGLTKNPEFKILKKINKRYDEITEKHCYSLLEYLYSGISDKWKNPLTKKFLIRDSPVIVSFLSRCYYYIDNGNNVVNINGFILTYKKHVLNFIDEDYLYRNNKISKSPKTPSNSSSNSSSISPPPGATSPSSNSPTGAFLPRKKTPPKTSSKTPPNIAMNVPVQRIQLPQSPPPGATSPSSNSPAGAPLPRKKTPPKTSPNIAMNVPFQRIQLPQSPPGAATNKPKSSSSSSSSVKIDYSPTNIKKTIKSMNNSNTSTYMLTEDQCKDFIKDIKKKKKGLTADQIKKLQIFNPISKRDIGFKSPIFQSLLYKCYHSFDNDKLKKTIKKVVSEKYLEELKVQMEQDKIDKKLAFDKALEAKRLADEKKKIEAQKALAKLKEDQIKNISTIEKYLDGLMVQFDKCCEDLISNCDSNGVLEKHIYITNIVQSIVIIIATEYLHLNYYYDGLYTKKLFDAQLPVSLFMYDDTMKDYCEKKGEDTVEELLFFHKNDVIIYQNNQLIQNVTKTLINKIPRSTKNYHLNTLLNRQYVFDIHRIDEYDWRINARNNVFVNPVIKYNKYNNIDMLKYVNIPYKNISFPNTLGYVRSIFNLFPFNFNITNSVLPRYIFIDIQDEVLRKHNPFSLRIREINEKLAKLPKITGIAKEPTVIAKYYDNILNQMKNESFGYDDTIRNNILYSLNAQTTAYIERYKHKHLYNIFYNYEYTGMFPLFTWVPYTSDLSPTGIEIYNMAEYFMWQPYGSIMNLPFKNLGEAYKNYGVSPWSKKLNEAIYKVITKVHTSIKEIPNNINETERLIRRVNGTLGVYMNLDIDINYKNNNIYLYHGTANRLHTIKDRDNDIEILGFLSTSLNIYTASYYSDVASKGKGYIYIIEVDDKKLYININDDLFQFILLPHSIIRILYEFNFGEITIILCRLIMTPTKEQNNSLYNNLLDIKNDNQISKDTDDLAGAAGRLKISGGLSTMIHKEDKKNLTLKQYTTNIIKPKEDMRKIGDMPEDIRQYYGITLTDKNKNNYIDINNGCYIRLIDKKKVNIMLAIEN